MKNLFGSQNSTSSTRTIQKQKIKATKYIFLVVSLILLQWDLTSADPESVEGLLADNIDHRAPENQPLKTKKKQYPLAGENENGNNVFKNKNTQAGKAQKLHEFQAQKHQKLLNAIEENDLPRIISSSRGQKAPSSAIRNILASNEARARNEYASDLAERNINFLNERARPPQNQGGFAKSTSGNNFPESFKGKEKDLSRFHPDTIGRISYRGNDGKPSRPFGKFLQSYPTIPQTQQENAQYQLPLQYQKSQLYNNLSGEKFMYPNEFAPIRYGMPNDAYNAKQIKENEQKIIKSQKWNGRINSMKEMSPPSNKETRNHKWPIQQKATSGSSISNKNNVKNGQSIINFSPKIRQKLNETMNKPILDNKVPQKEDIKPKNDRGAAYEEKSRILDSPVEQNLNQIPESMKPKNSKVDTSNPISSPSPILLSSTTIKDEKIYEKGAPKMEMLQADKKAFDFPYDTSDIPRDSVSALVIGMTFVVIFIVMALGLVGHSVYSKLRSCGEKNEKDAYFGRNSRGRFMRSPNEEDRTPPELRTGCGQPSFVQPELSNTLTNGYGNSRNGGPRGANTDQNGMNQPFFNGKLIFHEVNSNNTSMRDKYPGMSGINSHLPSMNGQSNTQYLGLGKPGEHLGAIPKKMPSPAANVQITDDLISPKYDDKDDHRNDSTESEEEDSSDDTVYECPGLAASSGDDIVVANPFFMPGQNFTPLVPTPNSPARKNPQPISKNEAIFHRGITGFN